MIQRGVASALFGVLLSGVLSQGAAAMVISSSKALPKPTQRTSIKAPESPSKLGSKWSGSAGLGVSQGVKDYDEVWYSSFEFGVGYKIDDSSSLRLDSAYSTILKGPDGSEFNNVASDPDRYGLMDTDLSYFYSFQKSNNGRGQLTNSSSLSFPTSRISRRASKIMGAKTVFNYRYQVLSFLSVSPNLGTEYVHYTYDDSDVGGFIINAPFRVYYGLSTQIRFSERISSYLSYSQSQRYDYLGDWRRYQSFSATLSATLSPMASIYAGYLWTDRIVTNEPVLAGENSEISAGTRINF